MPFSSIISSSYKTRSISWFLSASFLSNSLNFISSWSNKTSYWRFLIIWWSWFRFSSSSRLRVSFLKSFSLFRSKLLIPLHAILETLARKDLLDTILEFVKISAICWGTWIDKQILLMSLFFLCSSFLSIKSENLSQCKEFSYNDVIEKHTKTSEPIPVNRFCFKIFRKIVSIITFVN